MIIMDFNRLLVLSGLISVLIFLIIAIPLGFFFPGYNQLDDVISKQGAVDSPIMLQTNILFFLMGFFMFLFGLGMYRNYAKNWSGKTGSIFLILAGLSATLVGVFPCDPGCIDVSIIGELHQVAAETPLILAAIALVFIIIHEYTVGGLGNPGSKNKWMYIVIFYLIIGVIFAYIHLEMDIILPYPGLFQRLAIGIPYSLMAVVSIALYRKLYKK